MGGDYFDMGKVSFLVVGTYADQLQEILAEPNFHGQKNDYGSY